MTDTQKPRCPDCGSAMIWENQRRRGQTPHYRWRCGRCRRLQAAHKLTAEAFTSMAADQDNGCAICGSIEPLVIDHDHRCCPPATSCANCRRGLLCNTCNRFMGLAKDNAVLLVNAAVYLLMFDV